LSAITDSVGQGWNAVKISRYFKDITNDKEKQKFEEKQKMKTSCQIEEAFILLSTVKQMKYTLTEIIKGYLPLNVTHVVMILKIPGFASVTSISSKMTIIHFNQTMIW
jgi:hypothetical protein